MKSHYDSSLQCPSIGLQLHQPLPSQKKSVLLLCLSGLAHGSPSDALNCIYFPINSFYWRNIWLFICWRLTLAYKVCLAEVLGSAYSRMVLIWEGFPRFLHSLSRNQQESHFYVSSLCLKIITWFLYWISSSCSKAYIIVVITVFIQISIEFWTVKFIIKAKFSCYFLKKQRI